MWGGRLDVRGDPRARRPARRPLLPTLSRKEERSMRWRGLVSMALGLAWPALGGAETVTVQQEPASQESPAAQREPVAQQPATVPQGVEGTPDVGLVPGPE